MKLLARDLKKNWPFIFVCDREGKKENHALLSHESIRFKLVKRLIAVVVPVAFKHSANSLTEKEFLVFSSM